MVPTFPYMHGGPMTTISTTPGVDGEGDDFLEQVLCDAAECLEGANENIVKEQLSLIKRDYLLDPKGYREAYA